jgi:ABC-type sugar transport system permease subunit
MLVDVPIILIFSFFTAVLINQKFKGRGAARAIIFLPVILTSGVIFALERNDMLLSLMRSTMNPEYGKGVGILGSSMKSLELRNLLYQTDIDPRFISYITGAIDRIYNVISSSGVQILITLAGLQAIPASVYEASTIEGATGWENFWKITFPMVSPLILVNTVYTINDSFTQENNAVMSIIRETAFRLNEFGYSSAMAWIYFLIILGIMGSAIAIISKRISYTN